MFHHLFDDATSNQLVALFILVITALILLIEYEKKRTTLNLPPGPTPLPIIGNFLQMGTFRGRVDTALRSLRKKYGDIYMLKGGGSTTYVVINSVKLIKEALVTHGGAFSGRPAPSACFRFPAFKGVLFSDGQGWKNHRRFALQHLRNLGFGKAAMEENIHTESGFLLDAIRDKSGQLFDVGQLVQSAVSNVTCILIFGQRYSYANKDFQDMTQRIDGFVKTEITGFARYFPSVLYLPFGFKSTRKHLEHFNVLQEFIRQKVKEHEASFDPDSIRDLIDVYIKGGLDVQGSIEGTIFEEEEVVQVMLDMFGAGTETTTSVIRWGLLYVTIHQDVQERLRQEIENIVGFDRLPSLKDRTELHYTEAVLSEILRLSTILPLLIHRLTDTVKLGGYDLPVDATALVNLSSVAFDENEFPEPYEFRPQRFLDENGHFSRRRQEKVFAFGMGKRDCLGKSLAKTELFLFFTTIIQRFRFYLPEPTPIPRMLGSEGFVHSPDPYLMYAVET